MNIFFIEYGGPEACARSQIDKHVVKMTLETAQLLCSAHWMSGGSAPYRATHKGHPSTRWTAESLSNYKWLVRYGLALADEYTARYGKQHKCQDIIEWCRDNLPAIPDLGLTKVKLAIKQELRSSCVVSDDPVDSYRRFYVLDKGTFASWKRNKPEWFDIYLNEVQRKH